MKMKIRPDDVSMLQMDDWLAELRDDGSYGSDGSDGSAEPSGDAGRVPLSDAQPPAPAETVVPAERPAPAERSASAERPAPAGATVRALIGDQLRMPIMWCEMGSCISWTSDPAALGEADARARAMRAGWRIDAFGRLACPQCQQIDPTFRASRPVVPWDRHTALARAARIAVDRWTR